MKQEDSSFPVSPEERERAREDAFSPYANELGWLVYEWNRLHAALAELFAIDLATQNSEDAFRKWYELWNDKKQRKKLRKKVEALSETDFRAGSLKEVIWVLDQADQLSDGRNDAIHAPLVLVNGPEVEVMTFYFFGNPRAQNLRNKDLLKVFNWYRRCASILANYAEVLHYVISFDTYECPKRPGLPPPPPDRA